MASTRSRCFHAERHRPESNFNLTMSGFTLATTACASVCGDGIVASDGRATTVSTMVDMVAVFPDSLAPPMGDRIVQAPFEACDDGRNLATWWYGADVLDQDTQWAPFGGDGTILQRGSMRRRRRQMPALEYAYGSMARLARSGRVGGDGCSERFRRLATMA